MKKPSNPIALALILTILNLTNPLNAQTEKGNQTPKDFTGLIALDCEMGGLNEKTDALISIGAIYENLQNPQQSLSKEFIIEPTIGLKYTKDAFEVNGFKLKDPNALNKSETLTKSKDNGWLKISTETGAYQEIPSKPEKETILDLINYLTKEIPPKTPLAGCNIGFDIKYLKKSAQRVGLENEMNQALNRPIIDIQDLAVVAHKENKITLPPTKKQLEIDPNTKKFSTSLDSIAQATKSIGRNPHGFHDGLEDAKITHESAKNLLVILNIKNKEDLNLIRSKKKNMENVDKRKKKELKNNSKNNSKNEKN